MKLVLNTFSCSLITQGVLTLNDAVLCYTIELPSRMNSVNISCIPSGAYKLRRVNSPKFGYTFEVCDVSGRTNILIHKGNTVSDTKGCIMPCSTFGVLNGEIAGLSSKVAYDQLMTLLGDDEHELTIKRLGL